MTTASDEWIQQSLARLEELEEQRQQHEAALEAATEVEALQQHSQALEQLEAEMANLYERLEAAAGDGEDSEEESFEEASAPADEPEEVTPAPAPADFGAAPAAPAGFGAPTPAPAAPAGFGAPAAPAGFGTPAPAPSYAPMMSDDFDGPKKGGAAKWGLLIALVLGGGALGGYLYVSKNGAPEEAPKDTGPAKVISAGDVPPDTQGPKGAKGGSVDSSQGTQFKKSNRPPGGGGGGGGGKKPKEKKRQTYEITKTDDPLAGINK
ncbi:MAG: hypothetical protein H6713_09820 [Myxococcales bacterium]|nr:hypothetical protein [Myxococcales bacterium]MCB9750283.1 hypothetical protein [Myxococcales bacterium]